MGQMRGALSCGTILNGATYKYRIEKVLGQGSFGITYLASLKLSGELGSIDSRTYVAIKEFFMYDINGRKDDAVTCSSNVGIYYSYKQKFAKEAENLSKMRHSNIVSVLELFEANNTFYYVMEYLDGGSLASYIKEKGSLGISESMTYISQIADALNYMHQNRVLHLDLKPSNIMLSKDNKAVLIDFGLSKHYDENGNPDTSTTMGAGTPGFAPIEQISFVRGTLFPETIDVYALGATMYMMLTGLRPPLAYELLNDGFNGSQFKSKGIMDEHVIKCIAKAMNPLVKRRCQSVMNFMDILNNPKAIIDVDIVYDPIPEKEILNNSDFIIRPTTVMVRIDYSPAFPWRCPDKGYTAFVDRYGVVYGKNMPFIGDGIEHRTMRSEKLSPGEFESILSKLQCLPLSVRRDTIKDGDPFAENSETPEYWKISLYDVGKKLYGEYWISGWRREYGNIIGDIAQLNMEILKMLPCVKNFVFNGSDEDTLLEHNLIDDFRTVYGPPPGIDDIGCVYGPPPGIDDVEATTKTSSDVNQKGCLKGTLLFFVIVLIILFCLLVF